MATPRKTPPKKPPKRVTAICLDVDLYDWIMAFVPRTTSVSAFINQAVREKVQRQQRKVREVPAQALGLRRRVIQ